MKSLFGEDLPDLPKPQTGKRKHAHPAPPGSGPQGQVCGHCQHYFRDVYHGRTHLKCALLRHAWTRGPGTDIRWHDAACRCFRLSIDLWNKDR